MKFVTLTAALMMTLSHTVHAGLVLSCHGQAIDGGISMHSAEGLAVELDLVEQSNGSYELIYNGATRSAEFSDEQKVVLEAHEVKIRSTKTVKFLSFSLDQEAVGFDLKFQASTFRKAPKSTAQIEYENGLKGYKAILECDSF